MKLAFAIAGAIAALGFTSSALASTTITTSSAGAYDLSSVNLSGNIAQYGQYSGAAYAGPIVLQGSFDGQSYSLVTFCFDLFHDINVGFGYQANENYTYSTSSISNDNSTGIGTGNALSLQQAKNMSGLAQLGASLFLAGTGDLANEMPAIQAAIWHDEYGLDATLGNSTAQADYNNYIGMTFNTAPGQAILAENAAGQVVGGSQGLLLGNTAPVPEPLTWVMMILGMFSMGAALRSRARAAHAA